jgi:hypothetical protein
MIVILRASLLLALAVATPSSLAIAQSPAPAGRVSGPLADSLRGFAHQMVALLRDRDAEGALGMYGDTSQFVHVDNGRIIPWPELSGSVRRYLSTATNNPLTVVGQPGVSITDPDNAVLYVTHDFGAAGGRPAHRGVWTGVLHRFPEGWKVVHSHSSDRRLTR